ARADLDHLSRLRRVRAAAARSGLRRARDAEYPRRVRAEIRDDARGARAGEPAVLALPRRGQEARLLGPAREERRPDVREGPGQEAALEGAPRIPVRDD